MHNPSREWFTSNVSKNDSAPITLDELEILIRLALRARGKDVQWIHGFVAAQKVDGCLRDTPQRWMRTTAAARYRTILLGASKKSAANADDSQNSRPR